MHALLNKFVISFFVSAFIGVLAFAPQVVRAEGADVGLVYSNFRFSKTPLIAGESTRFYASIRNLGDADVAGTISFYLSGDIIGRPVSFSSVTSGTYEEVWVDFVVPEEEFNIDVQLRAESDINDTNNGYLSPRYIPLHDTDSDGVSDNADNCVTTQNKNQLDTNDNGVGDACEVVLAPVVPVAPIAPIPAPVEVVPLVIAENPSVEVTSQVNSVTQDEQGKVLAPALEEPAQEQQIEELRKDALRGPGGSVILSPNARFSYERIGWNVYVFKAYRANEGAVYTWEVSDGRTQVGSEVTLHFPQPGLYQVKLVTSVNDGTFVSEDVEIRVSFFHLQNPWLASLVAGLLVLCGVILWQGVRARKQPIE